MGGASARRRRGTSASSCRSSRLLVAGRAGMVVPPLLLLLLLLLLGDGVRAQQTCAGRAERCGIFGLAVEMHPASESGTAGCETVCSYFPFFLILASYECGACGPVTDFRIDLDLQPSIPEEDRKFFTEAREKWVSVITGDVKPNMESSKLPLRADEINKERLPNCAYPATIDDLYLCIGYTEMDGTDGILASGGPVFVRAENNLPVTGVILFDIADVWLLKLRGIMDDTVLHEMAHTLGFSTSLLREQGRIPPDGDCVFRGGNAVREYAFSGCSEVPLESVNNACKAHWDEACLPTELMSAQLDFEDPNRPLSRITIGLFNDMGYQVDYAAADPYGRNDLGPFCTCGGRSLRFDGSSEDASQQRPSSVRTLSAYMREYAMDVGRSILAERALLPPRTSEVIEGDDVDNSNNNDVIYVGDQIITILVLEDESVFSVVVTPEV